MRKFIFSLLFLSMATVSSVSAGSYTYKYHDNNGNVVYSQYPPDDDRQFERIKDIKGYSPSQGRTYPSTSDEDSSAPTTSAAKKEKDTGYSEEDVARRAKMKEENCKSAKEALDLYSVHKRFRDKDGNVITMPEEERQANIKKAEQAVAEFCN